MPQATFADGATLNQIRTNVINNNATDAETRLVSAETRLTSLENAEIVVNSLADLSSFLNAGTYELPAGRYNFTSSIDFGTADIDFITLDGCYLFEGKCVNILITYTGTSPFITSLQTGLIVQFYNFFITTPNATCVQLTNGNSFISTLTVFFQCDLALSLDTFEFLTLNDVPIIGCDDGIIADDVLTITMKLPQFNTGANVGGKYITVLGALSNRFIASNIDARPESTEFFMFVDPTYGGDLSLIGGVLDTTSGGGFYSGAIDQTNVAVVSLAIKNVADSKYIVSAFVNNNVTAVGTIVNNTFTDINFGTGGVGLVTGSTIERFTVIDPVLGIFEYTGNEPFDSSVPWHFTAVSAGGNVDFRFKWAFAPDSVSPYVDFPDAIESLVDVGSNAGSVGGAQPMLLVKGNRFKPQITRNSGTSTITVSYAEVG